MKHVPAEALNTALAFASHVLDDDRQKVRQGKVHRVRSGRPMTATRNRQPRTWAACGQPIVLAWPILDFHMEVWGGSDMCLKCWPHWEQLTHAQKSDVDLAYCGDLRQTGHVRDIPWRRARGTKLTSICTYTYPDGTRCQLIDHSAPGLAETHGLALQDEMDHAILEEQFVYQEPNDTTVGGMIRKALLEALIDEYGFDSEHWVELGSLERIAQAVEAVGVKVETHEDLEGPATIRVWAYGHLVFDGISRDSLLSYRGDPTHDEWGVRFPSGSVQVMGDEAEARQYSFKANELRPDLPVEVIRKVVTDWQVVPDGGH